MCVRAVMAGWLHGNFTGAGVCAGSFLHAAAGQCAQSRFACISHAWACMDPSHPAVHVAPA